VFINEIAFVIVEFGMKRVKYARRIRIAMRQRCEFAARCGKFFAQMHQILAHRFDVFQHFGRERRFGVMRVGIVWSVRRRRRVARTGRAASDAAPANATGKHRQHTR
jgi:hypothetical protein